MTLTTAPQLHDVIRQGLSLVSGLISLEIERMRASGIAVGQDEYRGLYISDADADRLMRTEGGENEATAPFEAQLSEVRRQLAECAAAGDGPLGSLVRRCGLSAFEVGCILLCLASETDPGLERLVAYAQDDVSKRRPRVELALRLMAAPPERLKERDAFHANAPLRRWRLISLHEEPGQPATPLIARALSLDARIAGYLLGESGLDEALQGIVQWHDGPDASLPETLEAQVQSLATLPPTTLSPAVIALHGPDIARCSAVAARLARGAGLRTLSCSAARLVSELGPEAGVARATREAALQPAALVIGGVDELKPEEADDLRRLLKESMAPLAFLVSREPFHWAGVTIPIPALEHETRLAVWRNNLNGANVDQLTLEALAGKFRLGMADIPNAAEAARGTARWRDPHNIRVNESDLYAAARAQSTPILNSLAKKVVPHYRWEDIVLPADPLQHLHEICGMVEHRHLVYEVWGFERKLAMGKGIISLFAGQSGTGKTMAADIIAGVLGLDMYKVDLSGVVSKYIGETEKNLSTIFAEAETSNSILFFDEADALFGKRSEVKDAHDRYANIETAYLLQRMEEYSGPVILSTNLKSNLDEAFLRRLHFVVDFPMPEEDERRRIWQGTIPSQAPLAKGVDFDFLARQFKLSGGNIRNIVLAAAFLAASDGGAVEMRHLIRATRREYQKLGKMVTEAEFGPYIGMLG